MKQFGLHQVVRPWWSLLHGVLLCAITSVPFLLIVAAPPTAKHRQTSLVFQASDVVVLTAILALE